MTLKPRYLLAFLIAAALFVGTPPLAVGHGHADMGGVAPAAAGSDQARLRAFETRAIGAEHAAAHARQRQVAQQQAQAGGDDARLQPRAAPASVVPEHIGGLWEDARPIPVIAINAILLPTGKVLMFAYPARPGYGASDYAEAYVWDPVSGDSTRVPPPIDPATGKPTNIWCGGASLLSDGRVLVTGGNVGDPRTDFYGLNTVLIFNPFTERWDTNPSMAQGRWYPSQVLMPDGRTLVASGMTRPGDADFDPAGFRTNNDLELISPDGTIERQPRFFNGPSGPPLSDLYPRMFWMPSGRALAAGPFATDSWFLRPSSPGVPTAWTDIPSLSTDREWGAAVLSGSRVLTMGGSRLEDGDPGAPERQRPAQDTTEYFDENEPAAGWRGMAPMEVARSHANAVLLPDGKLATVGGGYGEDSSQEFYRWLYSADQKRVELFDPATNSAVLGNPQAEARTYHSTALLLPDGRVMSAGDDINGPGGAPTGTNSDTAEIYSPPYLFQADGSPAPRPVIAQAPLSRPAGSSFEIEAAGAAATKAVLVAPGAATHGVDMSQRRVPLAAPVPRGNGRLELTLPADGNLAPPGWYMLFLLSEDGVPSVAKFILIAPTPSGPTAPAPAPPPPPPAASKPKLRITGALPSLRVLKRKKRFVLMVAVSEPGTITLAGLLERGSKPAKTLVRRPKVTFKSPGKRRVTFRLTRAGLRLLANKRRAVVRIRARSRFTSGRTLPVVQVRRRLR